MDEQTLPQDTVEQTPEPAQAPIVPEEVKREHHLEIYDILTKQDEITWQTIIFELIKTDQMDPWDVNVSKLSKLYISALKKLKEMNLRLSGKVLLAAALLLRIKSSRLVGEDMLEFDRLLASGENPDDLYNDEQFVEGEFNAMGVKIGDGQLTLVPRTPQPRKRKVSVYDLIDALAVALNVRRRRILSQVQTRTMQMPDRPLDITTLMDGLFEDVVGCLSKETSERLAFSKLVPGDSKKDKVYTFIPLLHLTNARKVDLDQKEHFGEIWITLAHQLKQQKLDDMDKERQNPTSVQTIQPEQPAPTQAQEQQQPNPAQ